MNALNLLIIDDSEHDQILYGRALRQSKDFVLHYAGNGQDGLEKAAALHPDLILLDYNLPDTDGLCLMAELAEHYDDHARLPPVIMLTGSGSEDTAVAALKSGATDYLVKQVDGSHLKLLPGVIRRSLENAILRQAQREAEKQQRLSASVFNTITEGVVITAPDGTILSVNPAYCIMTGYQSEELVGQSSRALMSDQHDASFYENLWACVEKEGYWQGEVWNRRKDGRLYLIRDTITAVRDNRGVLLHYVSVQMDITEVKRNEDAIRHQAYHDTLTGLPNRALLMERLRMHLAYANRHQKQLAVLFIDLDGFKPINDRFGHDIGDTVLREVADRLVGCLRESDTLARLGGDEFVAVLNDLKIPSDASAIGQKMLDTLAAAFMLPDQHCHHMSASIGVALYPSNSCDAMDLLAIADEAMYVAKHNGKAAVAFAKTG